MADSDAASVSPMADSHTAAASSVDLAPDREAGRAAQRRRALPLLALLVGSGLMALAAAPTWYSQGYGQGLTASLKRTGSQAAPGLLPLALVGLAGIAAVLASRGLLRRLVGVVVTVLGGIAMVVAVSGLAHPPADAGGDNGPPVARTLLGPVVAHPAGPLLAMAGGLLLAGAGIAVLAGMGARRLGQRFESGPRRGSGLATAVGDADDASQWWKAMDTGLDPTQAAAEIPASAPTRGTNPGHSTSAGQDGGVATAGNHRSGPGQDSAPVHVDSSVASRKSGDVTLAADAIVTGPSGRHQPVIPAAAERSQLPSSAAAQWADAVQTSGPGRLPLPLARPTEKS